MKQNPWTMHWKRAQRRCLDRRCRPYVAFWLRILGPVFCWCSYGMWKKGVKVLDTETGNTIMATISKPVFDAMENSSFHASTFSSALSPPASKVGGPSACLTMIIKNEGPILPRLFDSVKNFVSEYCILDTGSTDDTLDVLRSIDMPGQIFQEPFVDFATTRNFMLEQCRHLMTSCDYFVLLDADMVLHVSPEWDWAELDGKDVYNFIQISGLEYENVRMIRRQAESIKVVGATHEYYEVAPHLSRGLLPKTLIYIEDVGDGRAKGDKYERDERLLRMEMERDPNNPRTTFYLANTLKDLQKLHEAIFFYKRRADMEGWLAEADYSLYMLTTCYLGLGDLDNARTYAELAAYSGRSRRAEPLYELVFYLHRHGQYDLAWYYLGLALTIQKPQVQDALFISPGIYNYWLDYEKATLCPYVFPDDRMLCMEASVAFLNNIHVPPQLFEDFCAYSLNTFATIPTNTTSWRGMELNIDADNCMLRHAVVQQASQGGALRFMAGSWREDDHLVLELEEMREAPLRAQQALPNRPCVPPSPGFYFRLLGQNHLLAVSLETMTLYEGWMDLEENGNIPMRAYRLFRASQDLEHALSSWAFAERNEEKYCLTSWYPIQIGRLDIQGEASCQHFLTTDSPRIFTHLDVASNGVAYRGDFWFLARSKSGAPCPLYSMVVLDQGLRLKGYTFFFALGETDTETFRNYCYCGSFIFDKELVVFACSGVGQDGKRTSLVHRVPLVGIMKLMVVQ